VKAQEGKAMSTHAQNSGQHGEPEPTESHTEVDTRRPKPLLITSIAMVLSGGASAGSLSILMAPNALGPAILATVLGSVVSLLVNLLAMQNER